MIAWNWYNGAIPGNSTALAAILGIEQLQEQYKQEYSKQDIAIKVI
jgi:hypothetical protein